MGKKYNPKMKTKTEKYDPLNVLPQDVLDNIFHYLSVKDLLSLSLVSKDWYNLIGRSDCIKRIKVVYDYYYYKPKEMESLLKSNRDYQNIYVSYDRRSSSISNVEKEVKLILKKFSKSIKHISTSVDFQRICDLPKLRKIHYNLYTYSSYAYRSRHFHNPIIPCSSGLFSNVEFIEELIFTQNNWNDRLTKFLVDTLKTMKNLKVLQAPSEIINGTEYNFALRRFKCGTIEGNQSEKFIKFLKSQSATLQVLSVTLENEAFHEIVQVIFSMPYLNKLILESYGSYKLTGHLQPNWTIKLLQSNNSEMCVYILSALKSLEILKCSGAKINLLEALGSCPSLRKFQYGYTPYGSPNDYMLAFQQQNPNINFVRSRYFWFQNDF